MDQTTVRILSLSATGLTSDEVAERMGQSPDATREYIRRAMHELGAASKLEAVVRALRMEIIRI